jgi:hypothetical protein
MIMSTLLKLQIGSVQDFIAQARSTRDLWSGSYLLSWLMAAGTARLVKHIEAPPCSRAVALQAIISPSPGAAGTQTPTHQPLLKLHLYRLDNPTSRSIPWEGSAVNDDWLTANFTNILIAVLPADHAEAARQAVVDGIREEWKKITAACWQLCLDGGLVQDSIPAWHDRFFQQVDHFPSITWQLSPLLDATEAARLLAGLPLETELRDRLQGRLAATSDTFSAQIVRNSWQLDAVRQLREFHAWSVGGWRREDLLPTEKDSLTGREEQVVGGSKWWESQFVKDAEGRVTFRLEAARDLAPWPILFRDHGDWFGAVTLVKRLWHIAYLNKKWGLRAGHVREPIRKEFPFPSTAHVALHDPAKNLREDEDELQNEMETEREAERTSAYFAVLAMDGDEMGKWLSGEKNADGPTKNFRCDLSARLSTFALRCVRPIVEACDGRLIYAGGEDVLALLPADTVLDCARFLRAAYRGEAGFLDPLKSLAIELREAHRERIRRRKVPEGKRKWRGYYISPWLRRAADGKLFPDWPGFSASLPGGLVALKGTQPEISAGISIAHYKEPLQDVIQAAHTALNDHAKKKLDRGAVAVTLVKHSGETVEWGCKWESGGLELYDLLADGIGKGVFSRQFPHRVIENLAPYLAASLPSDRPLLQDAPEFLAQADEIVEREFAVVVERQRGTASKDGSECLSEQTQAKVALANYLSQLRNLPPPDRLRAVIGLCQTVAFCLPRGTANSPAQP